MSDSFRLEGSYGTTPQSGSVSLDPSLSTPILESMTLSKKQPGDYELTTNDTKNVAFGDLSVANVVVIKTIGGQVTARLTREGGSPKEVVVSSVLILTDDTDGYTALDLTRASGVDTTVKVFLGQKA